MQKDPFDSYAWLDNLHREVGLDPIYFFLLATKTGIYDKNIQPRKKAMTKLVQAHAAHYTVGIHPSWASVDHSRLLHTEKAMLESIISKPVTQSRQHYIRFSLPTGYRHLIANGFLDDYSMGYGSINGFRASVASSFYWFDLKKNESTLLRVHPFCFMDANSFYEQKLSSAEAYVELMQYYQLCRKVNGQLITIWHNNFLGTDPNFAGWKEMYKQFIA